MPPNGRKHLRTLYSLSERWPFNLVMEATETGSPPPHWVQLQVEGPAAAGTMTAEPSLPEEGPKFRREDSGTLSWTWGDTHVPHLQAQAEDLYCNLTPRHMGRSGMVVVVGGVLGSG